MPTLTKKKKMDEWKHQLVSRKNPTFYTKSLQKKKKKDSIKPFFSGTWCDFLNYLLAIQCDKLPIWHLKQLVRIKSIVPLLYTIVLTFFGIWKRGWGLPDPLRVPSSPFGACAIHAWNATGMLSAFRLECLIGRCHCRFAWRAFPEGKKKVSRGRC